MQKKTMMDVSHPGQPFTLKPHQQRPQQAGQVPQQRSTTGGRDKPVEPEIHCYVLIIQSSLKEGCEFFVNRSPTVDFSR